MLLTSPLHPYRELAQIMENHDVLALAPRSLSSTRFARISSSND